MKAKATIFLMFVILLGCKKGGNPNITLSTDLTNCPANSTCTYSYFDDADFVNGGPPVHGSFRVFSYHSVSLAVAGATSQFFFKTPIGDSEFDITSTQIAAGDISANDFTCPCCYEVLF